MPHPSGSCFSLRGLVMPVPNPQAEVCATKSYRISRRIHPDNLRHPELSLSGIRAFLALATPLRSLYFAAELPREASKLIGFTFPVLDTLPVLPWMANRLLLILCGRARRA